VQSRRSYPFRGCCRPVSRGWCGGGTRVGGTVSWNDTGLPAQHPHNTGDGRTVRVCRTAPGYDSQAVSEGRHGKDWPLTWAPVTHQSISCSGRESRCGVVGLRRPRARRRLIQGVWVPRARQRLARGGVKPSSEAEIHPRGRQALERSGDSPEGVSSP
jgi:hypothetical protein